MANAATLKSATPHATPPIHAEDARSLSAFAYAVLSHPGRVRHTNQDACAAAPEHGAFVVCDGVGGAAGGEIASQLAVDSFVSALRNSAGNRVPHSSRDISRAMSGNGVSDPHTRLNHAVVAANAAVYQRAQRTRSLRGMATTLVAALLEYPYTAPTNSTNGTGVPHSYAGVSTRMSGKEHSPTLWLAHAGDSRAYRLRAGKLHQLTSDHSLVEEQVRAGIVSRLDALRSPVRNVITRAVGAAPEVEPEIASHAIEPGDLYLLASDGLTRELTDSAIARILTAAAGPERTAASLETAAHALVDAANEHGGRDNITVLLLACR